MSIGSHRLAQRNPPNFGDSTTGGLRTHVYEPIMLVDMKPRIYIETSIPSYLTSRRRSRDLIAAANQELTQEWWDTRKDDFDLVISEFVSREAAYTALTTY